MNRWIISLFAALAAIWLLPVGSHAQGFMISGSQEEKSLEVQVEYDGTYGKVSACVFRVSFESELIDFVGTSEISGGYLVSTIEGNELRTVYSSWTDCSGLESVSFEFKAKKGSDITTTRVEVSVEQVAAQEVVPDIPSVNVEYEDKPEVSSEAKLLSLNPADGKLEPEFSPDITQYKVSVPYSVDEMDFGLSASPGAKVSVNRRKLGSGGSDTLFRLTVTAEDGVTKQIYLVNVHRGEYVAPTPKPTATPKPTNTPKPTATPKPTNTPKPTATAKAANTPNPTKTPGPTNTPKAAVTPKPDGTPKPAVRLDSSSDDGPGSGGETAPLTERVTIEKEEMGTFDRLSTVVGLFAAVFVIAVACTLVYEKVSQRREKQLKGEIRK